MLHNTINKSITLWSLLVLPAVLISSTHASHQPFGQQEEEFLHDARARAVATSSSTTLARIRKPLVRATTTIPTTTSKATPKKTTSTSTKKTTTTTTAKTTTRKTTTTTTTKKASTTSTKKSSTTTTKKPSITTTITSKVTSTTSTKAPTSTTTANSKKKGLSYNTESYTALLGKNVSWAYNWYSAPQGTLPSSIDFAPMLWSDGADKIQVWAQNVAAAKARGDTHLLGFNEPDLQWQADMTVAEAVAAWKKYMEPYHTDFKLVSPAVTNGGSPMGVAWLKQFIDSCTGCQIDAVAMHWYDQAWNTGYFTNYLTDAMKTFSPRPIWLTEFRGSGSAAEQITFINTVVPWMNKQSGIERYALFGLFEGSAADGNMITNSKLNAVGQAYSAAG